MNVKIKIVTQQAALADGAKLLKELKKLDDKNLLVEVQMTAWTLLCMEYNMYEVSTTGT